MEYKVYGDCMLIVVHASCDVALLEIELEGGDEHRKRPENVFPYVLVYLIK
jgi:hypothetical protein